MDNPLSLNRYTYVSNNPLRFIDPSGNKQCEGMSNCDGDSENWFEKTYHDVITGKRSLEGLSKKTQQKIKQRIYAPAFREGPALGYEGATIGRSIVKRE